MIARERTPKAPQGTTRQRRGLPPNTLCMLVTAGCLSHGEHLPLGLQTWAFAKQCRVARAPDVIVVRRIGVTSAAPTAIAPSTSALGHLRATALLVHGAQFVIYLAALRVQESQLLLDALRFGAAGVVNHRHSLHDLLVARRTGMASVSTRARNRHRPQYPTPSCPPRSRSVSVRVLVVAQRPALEAAHRGCARTTRLFVGCALDMPSSPVLRGPTEAAERLRRPRPFECRGPSDSA